MPAGIFLILLLRNTPTASKKYSKDIPSRPNDAPELNADLASFASLSEGECSVRPSGLLSTAQLPI